MASLNKELRGREKPNLPKFQHQYEFHWFRKLRWRERLMILLGANFKVKVHFLTTNSAGRVQPVIGATLTKENDARNQIVADNDEMVRQVHVGR